MYEPGMLIALFLVVLIDVVLSVTWTFTLNNFMHYGHAFGFLRWNHAKYFVSTSSDEEIHRLHDRITTAKDWGEQMDFATDLYWAIAATDNKMKLLVCPFCFGTRISVLTCFFVGVTGSIFLGYSLLNAVILIGCTLLFSLPVSVFLISKL